jgi:hypothetical protein
MVAIAESVPKPTSRFRFILDRRDVLGSLMVAPARSANKRRQLFRTPVASKLRRFAVAGQARDTPRRTGGAGTWSLTTIRRSAA